MNLVVGGDQRRVDEFSPVGGDQRRVDEFSPVGDQ